MPGARPASILPGLPGALLVALCATGCFSDRGVALEVDVSNTGAAKVELYLGKQLCDPETNTAGIDCKAIAPPPDGLISLAGSIWFRDDLTPYTADVKNHKATFQLTSDTAVTLPIVIAVGLPDAQSTRAVGTATLHDLAIPVSGARVVQTSLVSANPVVPADTNTKNLNEDRALVWKKLTPPSSCVVVEHWEQGKLTERDFVVPDKDPDCDDVVNECNPAAYHGASDAGTSGKPDCLVSATQRCVLGSHGCTDNGGVKSGTCAPQVNQVCVPQALCACASLDPGCIDDKITNPDANTIPRIECDVPAKSTLPGLDLCTDKDVGTIDLSTQFAGGQCGHDPALGSLQLGGFNTIASFGGAVMTLSTANKPCNFSIKWASGTRPTAAGPEDHGMIRITTGHGALLVPIVFHFQSGATACLSTPFTCSVNGSPTDSLWSCAP